MKRITLHWTGGLNAASAYEKTRYHFLIEGDGKVVDGDKPPEANRAPLGAGYVQHCGGMNSDNIGISLCGMKDARETPFDKGTAPITMKSYLAGVKLAADLCETYGITVSRNTVFLHSEVLPYFNRGIYKWDVNWRPDMGAPGSPLDMGNIFRSEVNRELLKRSKHGWFKSLVFWFRRFK